MTSVQIVELEDNYRADFAIEPEALLQLFRSDPESEKDAESLMSLLQEQGVSVERTTLACPVEFDGMIDGMCIEFYARLNQWRVTITPTVRDLMLRQNIVFEKTGTYGSLEFAASYMSEEAALERILEAVTDYKGGM